MGISSPKFSFFITDNDIKLILAPKSHKDFLKVSLTIAQEIVKLPGCLDPLAFMEAFSELLHYSSHID